MFLILTINLFLNQVNLIQITKKQDKFYSSRPKVGTLINFFLGLGLGLWLGFGLRLGLVLNLTLTLTFLT